MVDEAKWLRIASLGNPTLPKAANASGEQNAEESTPEFTKFSTKIGNIKPIDNDRYHRSHDRRRIRRKVESERANPNPNQSSNSQNVSRIKKLESTLLRMNSVLEDQKQTLEKQRQEIQNLHQKLVTATTDSLQFQLQQEIDFPDDDDDEDDYHYANNSNRSDDYPNANDNEKHGSTTILPTTAQNQLQKHDVLTNKNDSWNTKIKNQTGQDPERQQMKNLKALSSKRTIIPKCGTRNGSLSFQQQLVEISSRLEFLENKLEKFETELPKRIQASISKSKALDGSHEDRNVSCNCNCKCSYKIENRNSVYHSMNSRNKTNDNSINTSCSSLQMAESKLTNIEAAVDTFKEFLLRFIAFKRT